MKKKQATASEKRYMGKVASLGCIVCGDPANVHHIREGQGMGLRAPHFLTVPLCYFHHQGEGGIHTQPKIFEMQNGSELSLLSETIRRIQEIDK